MSRRPEEERELSWVQKVTRADRRREAAAAKREREKTEIDELLLRFDFSDPVFQSEIPNLRDPEGRPVHLNLERASDLINKQIGIIKVRQMATSMQLEEPLYPEAAAYIQSRLETGESPADILDEVKKVEAGLEDRIHQLQGLKK